MNCPKCQERLITRTGFCHRCRTPQNLVVGGKYRLVHLLGKGGFGEVYLCNSVSLSVQYALKLFSPSIGGGSTETDWRAWEARFIQEAKQMAALANDSPHIVQVMDLGVDPHHGLFYAMEFLYGYTLDECLRHNKSLGLRKTVELTGQICDGLQVAHKKGVFHRDLKPQNIFLSFSNGEHHAKLIDFGLAKVVQDPALNHNSALFGTALYAAPEQFSKEGRIDARTDLYALGGIVYCMLAGKAPFAKYVDDPMALLNAQCNEEPEPLREQHPSLAIPEAVDNIVLKALAKDPAHRYASVREFWAELQPWFRTPDYAVHVRLQQENNSLRTQTINLREERDTARQQKDQIQNQLTTTAHTLTDQQRALSDIQQILKAKEEALTAQEKAVAEEKQRAKATEQKLQQTEGTLHQLQEKLRHTEAELRKQREQPTLPAPIPVVPPKPTAPAIRKKPEPTTPQRTRWVHLAIASLLLVLLAWGGRWLAAAWRKSGSQTQPVAARKTDPPPRPADPRPASRSEETRPAARPAETRKPEPPPCYIDKTDSQPRATLASYAKTDDGRQFIEQSQGLRCTKLVRIPKGTFMLGSPNSDKEAHDDEKPQYRVKLTRDFAMWKTEITQQEFQDVMGYNLSYRKDCPTCPVEKVSWHEATAYSLKLSLRIGLISSEDQGCFSCTGTGKDVTCSLRNEYEGKKYYTCPGFRLPTEAEWEYAARGGKSEPRYGNLGDIAWYGGNSGYRTQPVCTKTSTPHPYGLCDILGNVWEWTWDWYQRYPNSLKRSLNVDPVGPKTGSGRVIRGGSYFYVAQVARAAYRYFVDPSGRNDVLGFRILLSLSE